MSNRFAALKCGEAARPQVWAEVDRNEQCHQCGRDLFLLSYIRQIGMLDEFEILFFLAGEDEELGHVEAINVFVFLSVCKTECPYLSN